METQCPVHQHRRGLGQVGQASTITGTASGGHGHSCARAWLRLSLVPTT